MSIFCSNKSDSSSRLARSFKNSAWSMSSLMTALPESPSTICSHASTILPPNTRHSLHSNTTHHATEFSTPRDHSFGMACNIDNDDNNIKFSTCLSDIDEWLEHANKFCRSSNHLTESIDSGQNGSQEEEDSRLSAMCNSYLVAPEHRELHNITLPCVREDSPVFKGQTCLTCTHRAAKCGGYERTRLIGPYDEFFDDVRRRKQEAERDAHKAKHVELMLNKQEKLWTRWIKFRHNDLERKQFKASVRTQKKLCLVREKAEKQKLDLRRSTMKRFQQMKTSETLSPSEPSWGSDLPLRQNGSFY
ncbi:hypothetical protein PHAVU_010G056900 [Phaseolus vulgaris]|uniref:Remorin C-terminal domain-containing protein n=1 Tax=Phaseolus vulgaris TaxID=3885 RepID=V7APL3_PHAVU|nr:hypothetical protein PHAVU_010G056900g [Phaseolus vulgaris]ESW06548.1 hypothetical protein PHAVU_010G056900g [Phaseolus vulgaris]